MAISPRLELNNRIYNIVNPCYFFPIAFCLIFEIFESGANVRKFKDFTGRTDGDTPGYQIPLLVLSGWSAIGAAISVFCSTKKPYKREEVVFGFTAGVFAPLMFIGMLVAGIFCHKAESKATCWNKAGNGEPVTNSKGETMCIEAGKIAPWGLTISGLWLALFIYQMVMLAINHRAEKRPDCENVMLSEREHAYPEIARPAAAKVHEEKI